MTLRNARCNDEDVYVYMYRSGSILIHMYLLNIGPELSQHETLLGSVVKNDLPVTQLRKQ